MGNRTASLRRSDGVDFSGGRQVTRHLVWNVSPAPVLDPTRAGGPFRFCPTDRLRVGVKQSEFIMLEKEGEDNFHLKIGKMDPSAAVYARGTMGPLQRDGRIVTFRYNSLNLLGRALLHPPDSRPRLPRREGNAPAPKGSRRCGHGVTNAQKKKYKGRHSQTAGAVFSRAHTPIRATRACVS